MGEKFPIDLRRYMNEPIVDIAPDELREGLKAVDMYVRFCVDMGYDYIPDH